MFETNGVCSVQRVRRAMFATTMGVVMLGLLSGCAGSRTRLRTQAEIKYLETREIRHPYNITYDGALNAIFSLGMTIEHSDKGSGVISGKVGDYAHVASLEEKERRDYAVKKVTLLIQSRGKESTQIRMKVLINEQQQLDRTLMTKIWQRIEREVMLNATAAG